MEDAITVILAFGGAALIMLMLMGVQLLQKDRLGDAADDSAVYVHEMHRICKLRSGPKAAALIRQSGNMYRQLGVFPSTDEAINEILKSFHRAKIDAVNLDINKEDRFEVFRLVHSHIGRAEGKKLGGAVIVPAYPSGT